MEKAKRDAQKIVNRLQYERAEEALSQMIQAAASGQSMPAGNRTGNAAGNTGRNVFPNNAGRGNAAEEQPLRVEKSVRELYGSLQNNLNRLKSGTSIKELRQEAIREEQSNAKMAEGSMEAGEDEAAKPEKAPGSIQVPPARTENINGALVQTLYVVVNDEVVEMTGKADYIYVDVFQFIQFDLSKPQGTAVETLINGRKAQYTESLSNGDRLEIFWKD